MNITFPDPKYYMIGLTLKPQETDIENTVSDWETAHTTVNTNAESNVIREGIIEKQKSLDLRYLHDNNSLSSVNRPSLRDSKQLPNFKRSFINTAKRNQLNIDTFKTPKLLHQMKKSNK